MEYFEVVWALKSESTLTQLLYTLSTEATRGLDAIGPLTPIPPRRRAKTRLCVLRSCHTWVTRGAVVLGGALKGHQADVPSRPVRPSEIISPADTELWSPPPLHCVLPPKCRLRWCLDVSALDDLSASANAARTERHAGLLRLTFPGQDCRLR